MQNTLLNAFALLVFLIFALMLVILFSVVTPLKTEINSVLTALGISVPSEITSATEGLLDSVITATRFIMWLYIAAIIISSFIGAQSFREYVIGTLVSIIATAIISIVGGIIWNYFVVAGGSFLSFDVASSITSIIVDNWNSLLLANLAAGVASFVWARGQATEFIAAPSRGGV